MQNCRNFPVREPLNVIQVCLQKVYVKLVPTFLFHQQKADIQPGGFLVIGIKTSVAAEFVLKGRDRYALIYITHRQFLL